MHLNVMFAPRFGLDPEGIIVVLMIFSLLAVIVTLLGRLFSRFIVLEELSPDDSPGTFFGF